MSGYESWLERNHALLLDFHPRSVLPCRRLRSIDERLEHATSDDASAVFEQRKPHSPGRLNAV
jgi:hypothetical protein